jgi:hypothetical protein
MKSKINKTNLRKKNSNSKKRRKTRRINKMKGGQEGFDETTLSMIKDPNTITPGQDTTKKEFKTINDELIDTITTHEDDNEEGSYPITFLDDSIYEYQEKSHFMNGFLRDNVAFYTEGDLFSLFKMFNEYTDFDRIKWYIINKDKINIVKTIRTYLPIEIRDKIKKISAIDYLFNDEKCPKFTGQTILYRGTDQLYNDETKFIDPAFISTTKTIDTLFTVPDKFIDKKNKCCIHVLLVDPGIPYIDLEKEDSRWKYQKEVLLPRGLKFERIHTGTYTYSNEQYAAFLYKISLPSSQPTIYNADDSTAIESLVNKVITQINTSPD